jgi:hypothetical protein
VPRIFVNGSLRRATDKDPVAGGRWDEPLTETWAGESGSRRS